MGQTDEHMDRSWHRLLPPYTFCDGGHTNLYHVNYQPEIHNSLMMTSLKKTRNATIINIHVMQCRRSFEERLNSCTKADPTCSTNRWTSRLTIFFIVNTPTNPRDLPNEPSHYKSSLTVNNNKSFVILLVLYPQNAVYK